MVLFQLIGAVVAIAALLEPYHSFLHIHALSIGLALVFIFTYLFASQSKILFKAEKLLLQGPAAISDDFKGIEQNDLFALLKEYLEKQYKISCKVVNMIQEGQEVDLDAYRRGEQIVDEGEPNLAIEAHFWYESDLLRLLCTLFNLPAFLSFLSLSLAFKSLLLSKEMAVGAGIVAWLLSGVVMHLILGISHRQVNELNLQRDLFEVYQQKHHDYVANLQTKRTLEDYHHRALEIVSKSKTLPSKKFKTN